MTLDIARAFKMTLSGPAWFGKIMVGVILWFFVEGMSHVHGIVALVLSILALSLLTGYSVRIMRQETTASTDQPPTALPEWNNTEGLVKNGIALTLLNFIWAMGSSAVLALEAWAFLGASAVTTMHQHIFTGQVGHAYSVGAATISANGFMGFLAVAAMLATAVISFFMMMMMNAHYAHEGRMSAVIELPTIARKTFGSLSNIILLLLVSFVLSLVPAANIFSALIVPALLSHIISGAGAYWIFVVLFGLALLAMPFISAASHMIMADLWGQAYRLSDAGN